MNKKRLFDIVDRLYVLVDAVPFPASGTQSTTISGLAGYAEDMRTFRPLMKATFLAILEVENGFEDDDLSQGTPEELLAKMESFVAKREAEGWRL